MNAMCFICGKWFNQKDDVPADEYLVPVCSECKEEHCLE